MFGTHMELQLEALLLQNRPLLLDKLGITPVDIVRSGPYRQKKTTTQQGCQIDYLIQTKTNSLFICEFKFKRREISSDIITEMQDKISRLKAPKGFAKVSAVSFKRRCVFCRYKSLLLSYRRYCRFLRRVV